MNKAVHLYFISLEYSAVFVLLRKESSCNMASRSDSTALGHSKFKYARIASIFFERTILDR